MAYICLRQTSSSAIFAFGRNTVAYICLRQTSSSAIFAFGRNTVAYICLRQTSSSAIFAFGRNTMAYICLRQTSSSAIFAFGRNTVAPRQSKPCGLHAGPATPPSVRPRPPDVCGQCLRANKFALLSASAYICRCICKNM